jgi:CHASE domain
VQTFSNEIVENAELIMRDYAAVVHSLSTTVTSSALSGQQQWPHVTVPYFEVRTREARLRADLDVFVWAPLVMVANVSAWEAYAVQHQEWIRQGLDYRGLHDVQPGPIASTVYPLRKTEKHLLPIWQMGAAPTNASILNMNLLTHQAIRTTVERAMKTGKAALSPIMDVQFLTRYSQLDDDNKDHGHRQMIDGSSMITDDVGSDPHALVIQPVWDSFEVGGDGGSGTIVGFVLGAFNWRALFDNTLAIQDMMVVLKSSCGPEFTYTINKNASLLGAGDLHDSSFDYQQTELQFAPFQEEWGELNRTSSAAEQDESVCKVCRKSHGCYSFGKGPSSPTDLPVLC